MLICPCALLQSIAALGLGLRYKTMKAPGRKPSGSADLKPISNPMVSLPRGGIAACCAAASFDRAALNTCAQTESVSP